MLVGKLGQWLRRMDRGERHWVGRPSLAGDQALRNDEQPQGSCRLGEKVDRV